MFPLGTRRILRFAVSPINAFSPFESVAAKNRPKDDFYGLKGINYARQGNFALFCQIKPRFMRSQLFLRKAKTTVTGWLANDSLNGQLHLAAVASLLPSQTSWTFVRHHRQIHFEDHGHRAMRRARSTFAIIYLITRTQRTSRLLRLPGNIFPRANTGLSVALQKVLVLEYRV